MAGTSGRGCRGRRVGGSPAHAPGWPGWLAEVVIVVVLLAGSTAWAVSTSAMPTGDARAGEAGPGPAGPVGGPPAAGTAVTGQRVAGAPTPQRRADRTATPAPGQRSDQPAAGLHAGSLRPGAAWWWPLPAGSALLAGFDPPPQRWLAGHRGVDLLAEDGAAVQAVADGVVSWVGEIAEVGSVTVLHDGGVRSTYQPLEPVVTQGQRVVAGQLLGRLAVPGSHCAPRACLHLGALVGRAYLDPALLLRQRPARLLPLPLPAAGQS